jgi:hypothetical protein
VPPASPRPDEMGGLGSLTETALGMIVPQRREHCVDCGRAVTCGRWIHTEAARDGQWIDTAVPYGINDAVLIPSKVQSRYCPLMRSLKKPNHDSDFSRMLSDSFRLDPITHKSP